MAETMSCWSSLPQELLTMIAKKINTSIDTVRFRAVCHSFRSSATPPTPYSPLAIPHLPFLRTQTHGHIGHPTHLLLTQSIVYSIEHLEKISDTNTTAKTQIVKFEKLNCGRVQVKDLLSVSSFDSEVSDFDKLFLNRWGTGYRPSFSRPRWNLQDTKVKEIAKLYELKPHNDDGVTSYKVAVSLCPDEIDDGFVVMAILPKGKQIGVWTTKDKRCWEIGDPVLNHKFSLQDIVYLDKNFSVLNFKHRTMIINSTSLKISKVVEPPTNNNDIRRLVRSFNDLLLIEIGFEEKRDDELYYSIHVNVFRLDREICAWVKVKDEMEDKVLFLSDRCSLSILADDFYGCEGNCVCFLDCSVRVRIFNIEDGTACSQPEFLPFSSPHHRWPKLKSTRYNSSHLHHFSYHLSSNVEM